MSMRSVWFCAALLSCLGAAPASAELVPITSYDIVGWKHQDPTIAFHLERGQDVNSISLFFTADNPLFDYGRGPVAAPPQVLLTVDGKLITTTLSLTSINAYADEITLSGFSIPSRDVFDLRLVMGPSERHDNDDYNQFVKCDRSCGSDSDGFDHDRGDRWHHDHDGFGDDGDRWRHDGDDGDHWHHSEPEPWVLRDVQFFAAAVPEPSTWVLVIAGFAAIGLVAHRRRARQLAALALTNADCCSSLTAGVGG